MKPQVRPPDPERWKRVERIFEDALEVEPNRRRRWLNEACGDDAVLRSEVEELLAADEAVVTFLDHAALDGDVTRTQPALWDGGAPPRSTHTPERPPPQASDFLRTDDILADRFRILRFIAGGGMGEVYEVEDLELHTRLAVKVIHPRIAADERAVQRFRREVHLARQVTHTSVCRSYDLFRHRPEHHTLCARGASRPTPPLLFLTMELLDGETVAERLEHRGPFRIEEALPVFRQIAEALAAAHDLGIVHRDLKCSNVMLIPTGEGRERIVVTDFGLARQASAEELGSAEIALIDEQEDFDEAVVEALEKASGTITLPGTVVGTPAYMAPEQLTGASAGPSVDIYAFGVLMYEMLTGCLPFGKNKGRELLRRIKEKPPSPRKYVPHLDERWEKLILRCLEPDLEMRPDCDELIALLDDESPQAERASAFPAVRYASIAAALLLAFLAVAFWAARTPSPDQPTPAASSAERAEDDAPTDAAVEDPHLQKAQEWMRLGVLDEAWRSARSAALNDDLRVRLSAYELQADVALLRSDVEAAWEATARAVDIASAQSRPNDARRLLKELPARLAQAEARGLEIDADQGITVFYSVMPRPRPLQRTFHLAGWWMMNSSQLQRAQTFFEASLDLADDLDDDAARGALFNDLGIVAQRLGELDRAEQYHRGALEIANASGDRELIARRENNVGDIVRNRGDLDQAAQHFQRAAQIYGELEEFENQARALSRLGKIVLLQGNLEEAEYLLRSALTIREQGDDERSIAYSRLDMAYLAQAEKRPGDGVEICRSLLGDFARLRHPDGVLETRLLLARLLLDADRAVEAREVFLEARRIVTQNAELTIERDRLQNAFAGV